MAGEEKQVRLSIDIGTINGIPLIILKGECDGFTAPFTHGAVGALIDAGYKRIIIDIKHLEFIDVAGFHALDNCCIKMAEAGGEILLVNPVEKIKNIYDVLRVRESCKMLKSIDEAMARLKAHPA
ncbi:MAG: STAS domain-containing protein [Firmicutes bacterium]|nr:STAS domain-containing protein [Bacillota bacterium]